MELPFNHSSGLGVYLLVMPRGLTREEAHRSKIRAIGYSKFWSLKYPEHGQGGEEYDKGHERRQTKAGL